MRNSTIVTLLSVMTCLCGCSTDESPSASNAPAASNEAPAQLPAHTLSTEEDASDFDPRLSLKWPGTPEESRRRIDAGTDRETTIYDAAFTQHQPLTSFKATVYEITEKDLQGGDPKEWLPHHLGGGNVVELTRKQIEQEPNKYLGFEITARDENLFIRRVNVLVGRRIYTVEVNSLRQERLNADDVAKFFESFAITERVRLKP
ncbi:MAG: hypothetical protein O2820_24890 [Planctomycetota bacterium]|nr:hypothetical protein [Planctomycetota bacterium]